MSNKENFYSLKPMYVAYAKDEIKELNQPMDIVIDEAMDFIGCIR